MSLHHVSAKELPTGSIPQLEACGDGGPLHVRHSPENIWNLHRAGGRCVSHKPFCPGKKCFLTCNLMLSFLCSFHIHPEERSAHSLLVS